MALDPYQISPEEPSKQHSQEAGSSAGAALHGSPPMPVDLYPSTSHHSPPWPSIQGASSSSDFSASTNPGEEWTKLSDLAERRRIQNRIAQRNYRKQIKERMQYLEIKAARGEKGKGPYLDKKEDGVLIAEDRITKAVLLGDRRDGKEVKASLHDEPSGFLDIPSLRVVSYAGYKPGHAMFDRLRLFIESYFGNEIDWWPLPPINRLQWPQQARLCWNYGGQDLSIIVNKHEVQELMLWLQSHSPDSSILPMAQSGPNSHRSPNKKAHQASDLSLWTNLLSGITSFFHAKDAQISRPTNPTSNPQLETYLCVDKCWTAIKDTRMSTIPAVGDMKSDYEYFCYVRRVLSQAEGNWLQRKLSWRSYTRVDLLKFHFLWDDRDEVVAETPISPTTTQDLCREYQFARLGHISLDIQMRVCAEIILKGIYDPARGHNTTQLLDSIPKLLAPPGLQRKQFASGWGFHAGQGLCMRKVLGGSGAVLALGIAFVPYWLSSIDKLDLQTAMAPLSFLATLVGIILAMLAIAHN